MFHCFVHNTTVRNIAIRNVAEMNRQMQESKDRIETLMNVANVGIATIDADGKFLSVNHQLKRILGYTFKELRNLSTLDITHPDDLEISRELFDQMKEGIINQYSLEKRYLKKDGSVVWV